MEYYETIIIYNGKLSVDEYNLKVKKYVDVLVDLGSKIKSAERMGKKTLAYEIKDSKYGWYVVFTYATNPENIAKLEKAMRTDEDVIKFLTMKRDPRDDEDFDEDDYKYESPIDPVETKSEQQPDALDVLLGFAKYHTKESD